MVVLGGSFFALGNVNPAAEANVSHSFLAYSSFDAECLLLGGTVIALSVSAPDVIKKDQLGCFRLTLSSVE